MSKLLRKRNCFHDSEIRQKYTAGFPPVSKSLLCFFLIPCYATLLQTRQPVFVQLLQGVFRVYHCNWLNPVQKASVEACIKVLSDVGKKLRWRYFHVTISKVPFPEKHTLVTYTLHLYSAIFNQRRAELLPSQWTWTVK